MLAIQGIVNTTGPPPVGQIVEEFPGRTEHCVRHTLALLVKRGVLTPFQGHAMLLERLPLFPGDAGVGWSVSLGRPAAFG